MLQYLIINYLESNQDAIEMIIKKNQVGLSALDYATMANNAKVAAFLAKLFYIFGQDVHGKDTQVSLLLNFSCFCINTEFFWMR